MLGEIVTPDEYISIIGGGNDATEGGDCVEVYGERAKSGSSGHVWNSNHALGDPDEQYYKNEMQNADGSWKHRTERGDSIPRENMPAWFVVSGRNHLGQYTYPIRQQISSGRLYGTKLGIYGFTGVMTATGQYFPTGRFKDANASGAVYIPNFSVMIGGAKNYKNIYTASFGADIHGNSLDWPPEWEEWGTKLNPKFRRVAWVRLLRISPRAN